MKLMFMFRMKWIISSLKSMVAQRYWPIWRGPVLHAIAIKAVIEDHSILKATDLYHSFIHVNKLGIGISVW